MNGKALLVVGGVMAGLFAAGYFTWSASVSRELEAQHLIHKKMLAETAAHFDSQKKRVDALIDSEPDLVESVGEQWPARLTQAGKRMSEATRLISLADKAMQEGGRAKAEEAQAGLVKAQALIDAAAKDQADVLAELDRAVKRRNQRQSAVSRGKAAWQRAEAIDLDPLEDRVEVAVKHWPAKKNDLERRFAALESAQSAAETHWRTIQEENGREYGKADLARMSAALESIENTIQRINKGEAAIRRSIDELYVSWEKTLADMEIQEGYDIDFRLLYRTVKVRIKDPESAENETTKHESWRNVSRSDFERLKEYHGMAIESKPHGKYSSEAYRVAQPAGFSYICPPEEKSNRYGAWEQTEEGHSHWVFHRRYGHMRGLFWGSALTPYFFGRNYGSYRSHLLAGKTWFGSDKTGKRRFGTGGLTTKTNYATTKMVKTDGFKSTKYVKTGGKYRGSRYSQTASRPSSSGNSFGGTSYRGSRYQSSGNSFRSSGSSNSTRRSTPTRRSSSFSGSRRR